MSRFNSSLGPPRSHHSAHEKPNSYQPCLASTPLSAHHEATTLHTRSPILISHVSLQLLSRPTTKPPLCTREAQFLSAMSRFNSSLGPPRSHHSAHEKPNSYQPCLASTPLSAHHEATTLHTRS